MLTDRERRDCVQQLANYPLLERARSASVERLVRAAEFKKVPRGTLLIREGEAPFSVCFVLRGVTRIFHRSDDGREFTPKLLVAPNHFGDIELISGYPANNQSVETLSEALVAVIAWEALREVLVSDHDVALGWLVGLAGQFVHTIDGDRHNVFTGVAGRVANFLLSAGEVLGQRTSHGVELRLPLTREQLANQVGSVKRSVLRVLQEFSARGWIKGSGSELVLAAPEDLASQTLPRRLGIHHSSEVKRVNKLFDQ